MKEIDKYMTVAEAAERWKIPENTVRARLKNREQTYVNVVNEMLRNGLIKYYVKPGGVRRDWIISEDAMFLWFGEKEPIKKASKTITIHINNKGEMKNDL